MAKIETIALVAHDNKKKELVGWIQDNIETLKHRSLVTTGTTGRLIVDQTGLDVERMHSGPLGGDQQIGARISEGKVDLLIFFWDPLEPMSHDPDIKALLRIASVWNIPTACNISSANFMIHSPLMDDYNKDVPDFSEYQQRSV